MSSARTPLPTDIVALVSFDGRVYPNEARPFERLGVAVERTHPLEEAIEQWFSFATGKQTWVSVRGATIRGLISARPRAKRSAWEVEVLIDASDDDAIALSLFSRMAAGVAKQGAERVFLRLDEDSLLRTIARRSGFFEYATEILYKRDADNWRPSGVAIGLRQRSRGDSFGVYQLQSRTVPANVRAIECPTFRDWQASQEKWGGRSSEMVCIEESAVTGWVRTMPGQIGRIHALSESGDYDPLLAAGLEVLQDRDVFCLAPEHQVGLAAALERALFEPVGRYSAMAKRIAKPVEELAPEHAGEAVPAG
jgi:hypothetical protein